jgi:hypothetical protein
MQNDQVHAMPWQCMFTPSLYVCVCVCVCATIYKIAFLKPTNLALICHNVNTT